MGATAKTAVIDEATRDLLIGAAVAAPSVHNSQPWLFRVGPQRIDVFADPSRQLVAADGVGRSLLISCGAALLNLRVAAAQVGFHPRVRLLPSREDRTHVAAVDLDHRHMRPGPLAQLYPFITARRTNRYPFLPRRIPSSVLSRLAEAVSLENAVLRVYDDPTEVGRIVDLLHDAECEEFFVPAITSERETWVGSTREGEGIPVQSLGPRPIEPRAAFRDLGSRHHDDGRALATFEPTPTVAVLSTFTDTPIDWVRAGQALERILLVATEAGLSASFMNQPLEHSGLRWLVRSPLTGHGQTQMILRLGYAEVTVPPTPRRPLVDVLR